MGMHFKQQPWRNSFAILLGHAHIQRQGHAQEELLHSLGYITAPTQNGRTPLNVAASNAHLEVVKFLIEQQAKVNVKTTEGWTPLYEAALNNHLEVVKFMIEQQAEVDMKTTEGWTPLHVAACYGHLEMVKFLIE
jgi:ankyrin